MSSSANMAKSISENANLLALVLVITTRMLKWGTLEVLNVWRTASASAYTYTYKYTKAGVNAANEQRVGNNTDSFCQRINKPLARL